MEPYAAGPGANPRSAKARFRRRGLGRPTAADAFAFLWAICGLVVVMIYSGEAWAATVGLLMVSQAFTGSMVWKRLKASRGANLPDFLTLVLLTQFGTKIITCLGILIKYTSFATDSFGMSLQSLGSVPIEYQLQAEAVFLLATVVFTAVWRWQEGGKVIAIWGIPDTRKLWSIYRFCLVMYGLVTFSGLASYVGMIVEFLHLFAIGAVAVLLGGNTVYGLGKRKAKYAIAALAPLAFLALSSGMKGEVALVMLPVLLPLLRSRLTPLRLGSLVALFLFVIIFLFPFTNAWRDANWTGQGSAQAVGISEVASTVAASWEREGLIATGTESTVRWLSRGSTAESGGLVMQLAERDGHIGSVLLKGLATIFVPRFLWPDKPAYAPGAWFTWYLGNADSPETATTATAMMLGTELYWMFGIPGVIFGMALLAILYFKVARYLANASTKGLVPLVASFAFMARSGGMEEIHTIYAVSSPIIFAVYVMILDRSHRMLSRAGRTGRKMRSAE